MSATYEEPVVNGNGTAEEPAYENVPSRKAEGAGQGQASEKKVFGEPPVRELGPLSDGWECFETEDGRSLFINHNDNTTTWIDPRTKEMSRTEEDLPYGWERAFDPVVGVYFMDHLNKRNVLEDPRLSEEHKAQLNQFDAVTAAAAADVKVKRKTLTLKRQQLDEDEEMLKEHEERRKEMLEMLAAEGMTAEEKEAAEKKAQELQAEIKAQEAELAAREAEMEYEDEQVAKAEQFVEELAAVRGKDEEIDESNIEEARATTLEIQELKKVYETEQVERLALEEEVRTLTKEVFGGDEEFAAMKVLTSSAEEAKTGDAGASEKKEEGKAAAEGESKDQEGKEEEKEVRTMLDLKLQLLTIQKMVDEQREQISELKALREEIYTVKLDLESAEEEARKAAEAEAAAAAAVAEAEKVEAVTVARATVASADAKSAEAKATEAKEKASAEMTESELDSAKYKSGSSTDNLRRHEEEGSEGVKEEYVNKLRQNYKRYRTLRRTYMTNKDASRRNPELMKFSDKLAYFTKRIEEVGGKVEPKKVDV